MTKSVIRASSFLRHSTFVLRHSSDVHPKPHDEFLGEPVNPQRNREQHEADHEKSAVMGAAPDHFAHLLRDNARHRVDRLENRTEALTEVRNRNPISSAE